MEHPGPDGPGVITVSVGAALVGASSLSLSDDEWFGVTDRALYEAKAAGRNRVCIHAGAAA